MYYLENIDEAPVDKLSLNWSSLNINKQLLDIIKNEFKFDMMTKVQAASIPLILANKDVIVEAKTGSGKTLSFLIPIVESLIKLNHRKSIKSHDILALILSPTRELSDQIHRELRKITKKLCLDNDKKTLVSHLMMGGNSVGNDLQKYEKYGGNILVATPGRLQSILEMKDNNLSASIRNNLVYLVFDEADQLLSLGFEQSLSSILGYLPKNRRTCLFSATQTSNLEDLVKSGLRNPIRINLNTSSQEEKSDGTRKRLAMPEKLNNYYHVCDSYAHKLSVLVEIIRHDESKKTLVFVSTRSQIDYFSYFLRLALKDKQVPILELHRGLKKKRTAVFANFKKHKQCIILSTDILSRGIDVPDISFVVHLDLPESPEIYVHRSGRSGHQIELRGQSLLLLQPHELDYVEMCRRRQIVLQPMTSLGRMSTQIKATCCSLVESLRERATKDADFEQTGIKAFVSYIRFYTSKMCLRQLLFPKLPIAKLANDFALLRLPKMPEYRKKFKALEMEADLPKQSSQIQGKEANKQMKLLVDDQVR